MPRREYIERVAAIVPAIIGVLAVFAVWALATLAFDRRAGFIAGLLAAVLPGHFLDRTLVGFVDHHALEVLLSFATLAFIVYGSAVGAGVALGLYLLAWASGSYFVFILAVWLVVTAILAPARRASAARFIAISGGHRPRDRGRLPGSGTLSLQHADRGADRIDRDGSGDHAAGRSIDGRDWRDCGGDGGDRRDRMGGDARARQPGRDRSQSLPSRPHAHGGARGAAAVPVHRQLGVVAAVDLLPQRLLRRPARRRGAGGGDLAIAQGPITC